MFNRLLVWSDKRNLISVRSFVLYATVWMTWEITRQAWIFAGTSQFDGVATAAIIAALTAPVSALQALVFKAYMENKQ